ncbi:MAG: methylenetetrahydrofolate--tRNA-(uracil(54)-C(5))-methyltransferase (FADH(2)-oxidizing) TrmFO [Candidatus Krumholzibacteriota bacterium]|nr:methylenetetrahydrofolate--tRNA-(uracil(54)-C(5))-methyltransferase (FADH(2)-oxidizing) TrmFO [Candidatus Krumholzibacteriota bacterium]
MGTPAATVIGAGLAGCEAALLLAANGLAVRLHEQKPERRSPAHRLDGPAELVCSNSLKSTRVDTAQGLLKAELRRLGSRLLPLAEACALPAGTALAVDPARFSALVAAALDAESAIEVVRGEVTDLPDTAAAPAIVATGPLTGEALGGAIEAHVGRGRLSFYDAVAPTVTRESLDEARLFAASRYGKGDPDYLNAPLDTDEYRDFVAALAAAERFPARGFEAGVPFFESCLPVEVLAERGPETLAHGPMRPVGLTDPATGRWPHAVLQLRRENAAGTLWGLVGCQTQLRRGEQRRVFRMIPALARAEFARYGAVHRNFFLDWPAALTPFQESRRQRGLSFAGQMTGVEGYVESVASGLLAARHILDRHANREPELPPETTLLGALVRFLAGQEEGRGQPMNAAFGLLPPLPGRRRGKRERGAAHAERSLADLAAWLAAR